MPTTDYAEFLKLFIGSTLVGFGVNMVLGFIGVVINGTLNIANIK